MIVSTTDPVTLHEIANPETHPFVIEGHGEDTLKIYFENEENRHIYVNPRPLFKDESPDRSNVTPITKNKH